MSKDDERVGLLADHYKETYEITRVREKRRERLLLIVGLLLTALLVQVHSPELGGQLAEGITSTLVAAEITRDNIGLFRLALWVAVAIVAHAYYQTDAMIERSYQYIHTVEAAINDATGASSITREGASYLTNYPKFSWWTWFLFKWLVPILIMFVPLTELVDHGLTYGFLASATIVRGVVMAIIAISTVLYLLLVHARK